MSTQSEYDEAYFTSFWRKSYKRKFHPFFDFKIWYITKFLKPENVLDVGCGTGIVLKELKSRGVAVKGIDISQAALDKLPDSLKEYCSIGDIRDIPFPDKSFDVVLCGDVLEHIVKQDIVKSLKELGRVAQHMMYIDITGMEDIFFIHSDKTHVSKYFSFQWHRMIQSAIGSEWEIKRGPIIPLIHHSIFVATRKL